MGTSERIAAQVRRALIAVVKTGTVAVAIDATGCSVHGPQQEVACSLVVWCPACWPTVRDGGVEGGSIADAKARDASKGAR